MRLMNEHSFMPQFKLLMIYIMTVMVIKWWMAVKSGFEATFLKHLFLKKKKINMYFVFFLFFQADLKCKKLCFSLWCEFDRA